MIFLLCFEGFWLININPRHQPVKLPPGKIPDLRLLPGPLIAAADRQALIDQNEAVRFVEQGFDPVPSSSTEKEESTGRWIHLKLVFDNGAESVANSHFLRTAGPHFPDSPGHIKRTAWDISRAEGSPPY